MIKMERLRKNMLQGELALGICSPSYLSKIENGTAIPGDEIEQMLLQRLNIPMEKIHQHSSSNILDQFKKQFGHIINSRDKQAAQSLCQEIRSFLAKNEHHPDTVSLLLIATRLLLMTSPSDVEENLALLISFQSELSHSQQFHLHIIQGIIAFNENQYSNARYIFTKAAHLTKQYKMEDWEIAELHYVLSLAAVSEHQHMLAINHIQKALSYFNRKVLATRSIDCLLILGNAQKHTKNVRKALDSFENAKEIMVANGVSNRIGMIEHNLGACHSVLKNHERAIYHFTQSLLAKNQVGGQETTILALVKEHKKMGNIEQAKNFVKKGISLLDRLTETNKIYFSHHFAIYKVLLYEEDDMVSTFDAALDYFKHIQKYSHCFVYCNVLAAKLAEKNQFKMATTYYQMAFSYHLTYHQLEHWEELT